MGGLLLTIDTATTAGSIALSRGETLLGEVTVDSSRTHSDRLLCSVERLLADCDATLGAVAACAVVRGPGSFTGVRVGIATAKGLAAALDCPLIPLSSLEVLAAALPLVGVPVCALLDARKGQVYTATYTTASGEPQPLGEERVVDPAVVAEAISEPTILIGSGALAYRALLVERLGAAAIFPPFDRHLPRAGCAVPLARRRWQSGEGVAAAQFTPCYIRPSEAELAFGAGK